MRSRVVDLLPARLWAPANLFAGGRLHLCLGRGEKGVSVRTIEWAGRVLLAGRADASVLLESHENRTLGPVNGKTVVWHDDEGWGVLTAPDVRGKVWAHFSSLEGEGHRSLKAGDPVVFTYETPGQDGYAHRALRVELQ